MFSGLSRDRKWNFHSMLSNTARSITKIQYSSSFNSHMQAGDTPLSVILNLSSKGNKLFQLTRASRSMNKPPTRFTLVLLGVDLSVICGDYGFTDTV